MKILPHYKFRNENVTEFLLAIVFKPLMILIATGKDSHWWNWEEVSSGETSAIDVCPQIKHPAKRKYRETPFFGKYNFSGIRDLYLTLFVLQEVVVLEPRDYNGEWSLIMKYESENGIKCEVSHFIHKGRVKTLMDGKRCFVGITVLNQKIPLRVVEHCARSKHHILFI